MSKVDIAAFSTKSPLGVINDRGMKRSVAVVGNPNCGKSTLFNALTGSHQPVGNWAGVTVEREVAIINRAGLEIGMVDLPGVYSLSASTRDEEVTRDFVSGGSTDLLVNVIDASNFERNLYLTMQLIEIGTPLVVALNMLDTAHEHGYELDADALSKELGCPVVKISASKRQGLDDLLDTVASALVSTATTPPRNGITYVPELEAGIQNLTAQIDSALQVSCSTRWVATRLLEGDSYAEQLCSREVADYSWGLRAQIEASVGEDIDILAADARYERISEIAATVLRRRDRLSATRSEKIDKYALHPTFGVPIFLGVMYVMFMLTINVGSAFIDLFDVLGGALLVHLPGEVLSAIGVPAAIVAIVQGVGGGVQTVVTFIPPVGIMFLCLRFLEDSGYMARAAFVTDRLMRALGLPGKAFVPMIVGFGCNVPAIMGARTLESERDRKLAVAMNPFMSCGARLPVYALFAAAFFPKIGQIIVFVLYMTGIGFAIITGLILKRTLLAGDLSPFIMELPPYHRPSMSVVVKGAWQRLRSFVVGAGKFIVPIVAVLTLLGSVGVDGSFGNENTDKSVLSAVGRTLTPVFSPLGVQKDNWPATVGIFTGVFAKEVVVGTLDSLYAQISRSEQANANGGVVPAKDEGVVSEVKGAFIALPGSLFGAFHSAINPIGASLGAVGSKADVVADQDVDKGTFGVMAKRFDGGAGAFAYLLFILLYMPCVAATAAIYRETSAAWAAFVGAWTTALAWGVSTLFYQVATFTQHPSSSLTWVLFVLAMFLLIVHIMSRNVGAAHTPPPPPFCHVVAQNNESMVPPVIACVEPEQADHTHSKSQVTLFSEHKPLEWGAPDVSIVSDPVDNSDSVSLVDRDAPFVSSIRFSLRKDDEVE